MSLISVFESYNFLFHSLLRLLRTYMPMTAKGEGGGLQLPNFPGGGPNFPGVEAIQFSSAYIL